MAPSTPVNKIAIIGINGRIGGAFAKELLKSGKHTITALIRKESKGTVPGDAKAVQVDYDNEETVVGALKGQQFLIITLGVRAPQDLHSKIVKAAVKAGVPYIMPNSYGYDIHNENLKNDPYLGHIKQGVEEIKDLGASYVTICCGYWYEWSLALGNQWFGIDIKNNKVTFFDDGKTKINVSTWDQCGRAVAALLDLPESGAKPALSDWKNEVLYFDSWKLSQRDMLDSLNRVLGTTDKDWEITYEPTEKRYKDGIEEQKNGIFTGFAKMIYSRIFFPTGDGDYESTRGLSNELLNLPKEDLDEYTKKTVEMVESGWSPFG